MQGPGDPRFRTGGRRHAAYGYIIERIRNRARARSRPCSWRALYRCPAASGNRDALHAAGQRRTHGSHRLRHCHRRSVSGRRSKQYGELELKDADGGINEIRSHENSLVRYYNVPKYARFTAEAEEANEHAEWHDIRPGEGRDVSAAAYFFAMKLQQHLNMPVGIIDCYWGGSSVTCWMDRETLESISEGQRYLKEFKKIAGRKTMAAYLAEGDAKLEATLIHCAHPPNRWMRAKPRRRRMPSTHRTCNQES